MGHVHRLEELAWPAVERLRDEGAWCSGASETSALLAIRPDLVAG
ncbi:MAG TPA: hypothetical protein VKF59_14425 [Candidatus Dormibacteraeota bacterium]|nr:hypothetical protein [Candidatus Dormibacteraeota bacterium]